MHLYACGPQSLENYFQKGALLGQKAALNLWYVDTRPNSQKLFLSIRRTVIYGLYMFSYMFYSHNSIVSYQ